MKGREIAHILQINGQIDDVPHRRTDSLEMVAHQVVRKPGLCCDRPIARVFVASSDLQETPLLGNILITADQRGIRFGRIDGNLPCQKQVGTGADHVGKVRRGIVLPASAKHFAGDSIRPDCNRVHAEAGEIVGGYEQVIGDDALPIIREATSMSPEAWNWLDAWLQKNYDLPLVQQPKEGKGEKKNGKKT